MKEDSTTFTISQEWPGAFGLFKISRNAIRHNIGTIVLLLLGLLIAIYGISFFVDTFLSRSFATLINQLDSLFLGSFFTIGLIYAYISSASNKKVELKSTLTMPISLYRKMILLNLLVYVSVIGGLILFIVPGIIIAMRLSLAPYYLVDQNLGVVESYKASWRVTEDHLGKILGIFGVCVLMILPVITIIGVIASVYLLFMYSAANAFLYLYLLQD